MCVVHTTLDAINPVDRGEKSSKNKKNSPFAGACLSVCLSVLGFCRGNHPCRLSKPVVVQQHPSTRLAVAEKTKKRERKTSGILGAYAAGLMILILILSCMYLKFEVPVDGFSALGSSEKARPVFLIRYCTVQIRTWALQRCVKC